MTEKPTVLAHMCARPKVRGEEEASGIWNTGQQALVRGRDTANSVVGYEGQRPPLFPSRLCPQGLVQCQTHGKHPKQNQLMSNGSQPRMCQVHDNSEH